MFNYCVYYKWDKLKEFEPIIGALEKLNRWGLDIMDWKGTKKERNRKWKGTGRKRKGKYMGYGFMR